MNKFPRKKSASQSRLLQVQTYSQLLVAWDCPCTTFRQVSQLKENDFSDSSFLQKLRRIPACRIPQNPLLVSGIVHCLNLLPDLRCIIGYMSIYPCRRECLQPWPHDRAFLPRTLPQHLLRQHQCLIHCVIRVRVGHIKAKYSCSIMRWIDHGT